MPRNNSSFIALHVLIEGECLKNFRNGSIRPKIDLWWKLQCIGRSEFKIGYHNGHLADIPVTLDIVYSSISTRHCS